MPYDWTAVADTTADVLAEYASGYLVTVGTAQVACTESVLRASWAAEQWGRDNTYKMTLTIALSALASLPAVRSTVTYRGTSYRIIDIATNNLAGMVQLHLADV